MNLNRPLSLVLCFLLSAIVAAVPAAAQDEKTEGKKESAPVKQEETKDKSEPTEPAKVQPKNVFDDVEIKNIAGEKVPFSKYQGKVVLIVNVASKCGFTGQYKPLQALHKQYQQHGLEVVAFPCNQFGKQEPKSNAEINQFCTAKFGIDFDMYSKTHVRGGKQAKLFKRLTELDLKPAGKGEVKWNFEKFLIGKDGQPLSRFRSNISPDDKRIVSQIRSALGMEPEQPVAEEKSADVEPVSKENVTPEKSKPSPDVKKKKS